MGGKDTFGLSWRLATVENPMRDDIIRHSAYKSIR
jgi:hypothetical protein